MALRRRRFCTLLASLPPVGRVRSPLVVLYSVGWGADFFFCDIFAELN